MEKVYLIDGSSYIFRAFYAVAPLTTAEGFPTNALFGFTRMLLKLIDQAESNHVIMVFDAGKETFRNQLYPLYKANRSECPEDLVPQMPYFRQISKALGLHPYELVGFEADDIIATLTKRLASSGHEVIVVTGDKDLMQLVNDQVSIWDTMKEKRYHPADVKEKMGVPPELVVDFLGLTGDSSDNIPGLSGVGPKTAIQLIEAYGSIENIIAAKAEIENNSAIRSRKKIAELLEKDEEILRLSRKLVEVCITVPVQVEVDGHDYQLEQITDELLLKSLTRKDPDSNLIQVLIDKLEFQSLLKNFKGQSVNQNQEQYQYNLVSAENFSTWLAELKKQTVFAVDLETTSLDVLSAEIVGLAFCWSETTAWYLPVGHVSNSEFTQVKLADCLEVLKPILEDPKINKYGQNIKYDLQVFARYQIELQGLAGDSMLAAFLIEPDKRAYSLGELAKRYLKRSASEYADVTSGLLGFQYVDIQKACNYAAEDAHYAFLLCEILGKKIKELDLDRVYYEIELPLINVLAKMEMLGILLDSKFLGLYSLELAEKIALLEKELYLLAGQEFNLNSPKQLAEIMFEKLGYSTRGIKKTKTGFSTDSSVLEKLADDYELPRQILAYRGLHKLKSTYVDSLPAQVSKVTGRLHTKFNQTIAATGRLSSSDPNLQNIPIQSLEGRKVRKAFIAKENYKLISADYSQIELRILAHLSQDPNFIEAFRQNQDIHSATARDILGLTLNEEIGPEQRRIGKLINFGIIYGMSAFRLSKDLGLPLHEAKRYIDSYFAHYAGIKKYFESLEKAAERDGYVSTMFGRKRFLADIDTSGRGIGFLQRVATNAPIQGSAADLVKLAMLAIDSKLKAKVGTTEELKLNMLLQIHDELVFECHVDHIANAQDLIRAEMENVVKLLVPLRVDVHVGNNWDEAH